MRVEWSFLGACNNELVAGARNAQGTTHTRTTFSNPDGIRRYKELKSTRGTSLLTPPHTVNVDSRESPFEPISEYLIQKCVSGNIHGNFYSHKKMKKNLKRKYFEIFILMNLACGFLFYIASKSKFSITTLNRYDYGTDYLEFKKHESNWTRVLIWTTYFESTNLTYLGLGPETFKMCEINKCLVTFDRNILPICDGVVFHGRDLIRNDMPYPRFKDQIWIFMLQESPLNTHVDLSRYNNVFNWTMTYRQDSEIYHPYAQVVRRDKGIEPFENSTAQLRESLRNKNLVAWIVSHCETESGRENYVKELSIFIPVDIYGDCGSLKCFRDRSCYPYIADTYKFYLSFENSHCTDYVTEKFFNALKENIVPVVLGSANYSRIAPPGSFIDTRDFKSAKELSEYLLYLDSHPEEYLKFFEWKKDFKIQSSQGWCSLCAKLRERKKMSGRGEEETHHHPHEEFYSDLAAWWNHQSNSAETKACTESKRMSFFSKLLKALQFTTA